MRHSSLCPAIVLHQLPYKICIICDCITPIQNLYNCKTISKYLITHKYIQYCPHSDVTAWSVQIWSFFWSVFSRIRTDNGEIRNISPYSVRMTENTDQKKLHIWALFSQMYFSTFGTVWTPKKSFSNMFSCIIYVKLNKMVYEYFSNKRLFNRLKYTSPKASNIKYFWILSSHHEGVSCMAKLSIL